MSKTKFMILSAAAIIGLCSCDQIGSIFGYSSDSSAKASSSQASQSSASSSAAESSQQSSQTSISQGESEGYTTYHSTNDRLGAKPLANCFYGGPCLDSVGSKKVLVLPVSFRDAFAFSQAELDIIDKAYNGSPSDTGWQSLSSYYAASSYGKLELDCVIAPAYRSDYTTSTFQNRYNTIDSFFGGFLEDLLDETSETINLSDFDLDQDGFIDALQIVYKNNGTEWDGNEKSTAVWWNYTYMTDNEPGTTRPNAGVYFWSEFQMIQTGYYAKDIDAHTLVHEMGHMLGIDDYYSYDEDKDGDPAGLIDMMNMNVGDHCAATKLLLGWVDPFVPDGTKEEFNITLRDFESTGDCMMLIDPSSWNGTGYDEYFTLEYYTPTGLNESDAVNGYQSWYSFGDHGKIYQQPGLKVFHVDHRLGKLVYSHSAGDYVFSEFTDEYAKDPVSGSFSTIVSSNSSSYSHSGYNKLEFISGDGVNYFNKKHNYDRQFGRQKLLFGTSAYNCGGTTFDATTCSSTLANGAKMNDNTDIPYGFEVLSQTDDAISIKVSKL